MGIKGRRTSGHWGCAGLLHCYIPHRAMTFQSELLSYGRSTIPFQVRVSHLRLAWTKGLCHTKEWQMNGSVYKVLTGSATMTGVCAVWPESMASPMDFSSSLLLSFMFLSQLGWMGSWKQSSQICGQQPCKTKRASKGQSVSFSFSLLWNFLVLWRMKVNFIFILDFFFFWLPCTAQSCCDHHLLACSSFPRDHYVEGKMRGLAPSKKIAAVQQKNVDLWASFLLSNLYLTHC